MGEVSSVGIPGIFGLTGEKTAFQDEGVLLGDAQVINFTGAVTATLAAGVLTVDVDGGAALELVTTLEAVTETDTTHAVAASVVFELGTQFGQALGGKADNGDVTDAITTANNYTDTAVLNKADLVDGLVPANQLPSYVDDVLEYANLAAIQAEPTPLTGKIYIALDTNLTYRWTGSTYGVLDPSLALGETLSTAYRGDMGKAAYDHSQIVTGNPHGTVTTDITEGTNKYFTDARAVGSVLTGLSTTSTEDVLATDSVLVALGKLQAKSLKPATLKAGEYGFFSDFVAAYMSSSAYVNSMITPELRVYSGNGGHNQNVSYSSAIPNNARNKMLGFFTFDLNAAINSGISTWDASLGTSNCWTLYGGESKFYCRFLATTYRSMTGYWTIGFCSNLLTAAAIASTDIACCFQLSGTVVSLYCANGSGVTQQTSVFTIVRDTAYDFAIVATTSEVKFYINGTQIGTTITTNIPQGSYSEQSYPDMGVGMATSSAVCLMCIDAMAASKTLTTARTMYLP